MNLKQIKDKLFKPQAGTDNGRNKKMAILMAVLFIIFIFVIVRAFSQLSPSQANANIQNTAKPGIADSNSVSVSEKKINWRLPDSYPETLRDPMQTSSSAAGAEGNGDLIVKGIIYCADRPSAVIDEKIVHQGDKISGTTVVKINKNNVEFEKDGKKWTQEVQR